MIWNVTPLIWALGESKIQISAKRGPNSNFVVEANTKSVTLFESKPNSKIDGSRASYSTCELNIKANIEFIAEFF